MKLKWGWGVGPINGYGAHRFQWYSKSKLFVINEGGRYFVFDVNFTQWYLAGAFSRPRKWYVRWMLGAKANYWKFKRFTKEELDAYDKWEAEFKGQPKIVLKVNHLE